MIQTLLFLSRLLRQRPYGLLLLGREGWNVVGSLVCCQLFEAHITIVRLADLLAAGLDLSLVHIAFVGGIKIDNRYLPVAVLLVVL